MIAKYSSDRQFYVWHLVYLDRSFLLSDRTCRRACDGWVTGWDPNVNVIAHFRVVACPRPGTELRGMRTRFGAHLPRNAKI